MEATGVVLGPLKWVEGCFGGVIIFEFETPARARFKIYAQNPRRLKEFLRSSEPGWEKNSIYLNQTFGVGRALGEERRKLAHQDY